MGPTKRHFGQCSDASFAPRDPGVGPSGELGSGHCLGPLVQVVGPSAFSQNLSPGLIFREESLAHGRFPGRKRKEKRQNKKMFGYPNPPLLGGLRSWGMVRGGSAEAGGRRGDLFPAPDFLG